MSFPLEAGMNRVRVFTWCLPPFYSINKLDGQTVSVAVRVKLANSKDDDPSVDLSDITANMIWGSSTSDQQGSPDCQEIEFDPNGGALTVLASTLTIFMTYPGLRDKSHPQVDVDVSVGIGTSGKSGIFSSAQKTVKVEDLAAFSNSADLLIPAFAVGATLVNNDVAVPALIFDQLRAPNGILTSRAFVGKNPTVGVPIARGLGARAFHVSTQASPSQGNAIIFDLSPN